MLDIYRGLNGTVGGGGLFDAGPPLSIVLNGSDAPVINDNDLFYTNQFTAFAWVNGAAQAQNRCFLSQYDNGVNSRAWAFFNETGAGTKFKGIVCSTSLTYDANALDYTSSLVIWDSTWHSCCIRWNAGLLDLFVDGVRDLSPTKNQDPGTTVMGNSTAKVCLGGITTSGGFGPAASLNSNQKLTNIRFYNTAKSDAEIAALHALGNAG
jgi:hypothetical protein